MRIFKTINYLLITVSIGILLMFMFGEGFEFWKFTSKELILSIFFPVGLITGLVIAYWKERIGGYIVVLSVFAFYIVNYYFSGDFPRGIFFFLFVVPGLLLLLYALIEDIKAKRFKK